MGASLARPPQVTSSDRRPGGAFIGCLEERLGRKLTGADFADMPVNNPDKRGISQRMRDRLAGVYLSPKTQEMVRLTKELLERKTSLGGERQH